MSHTDDTVDASSFLPIQQGPSSPQQHRPRAIPTLLNTVGGGGSGGAFPHQSVGGPIHHQQHQHQQQRGGADGGRQMTSATGLGGGTVHFANSATNLSYGGLSNGSLAGLPSLPSVTTMGTAATAHHTTRPASEVYSAFMRSNFSEVSRVVIGGGGIGDDADPSHLLGAAGIHAAAEGVTDGGNSFNTISSAHNGNGSSLQDSAALYRTYYGGGHAAGRFRAAIAKYRLGAALEQQQQQQQEGGTINILGSDRGDAISSDYPSNPHTGANPSFATGATAVAALSNGNDESSLQMTPQQQQQGHQHIGAGGNGPLSLHDGSAAAGGSVAAAADPFTIGQLLSPPPPFTTPQPRAETFAQFYLHSLATCEDEDSGVVLYPSVPFGTNVFCDASETYGQLCASVAAQYSERLAEQHRATFGGGEGDHPSAATDADGDGGEHINTSLRSLSGGGRHHPHIEPQLANADYLAEVTRRFISETAYQDLLGQEAFVRGDMGAARGSSESQFAIDFASLGGASLTAAHMYAPSHKKEKERAKELLAAQNGKSHGLPRSVRGGTADASTAAGGPNSVTADGSKAAAERAPAAATADSVSTIGGDAPATDGRLTTTTASNTAQQQQRRIVYSKHPYAAHGGVHANPKYTFCGPSDKVLRRVGTVDRYPAACFLASLNRLGSCNVANINMMHPLQPQRTAPRASHHHHQHHGGSGGANNNNVNGYAGGASSLAHGGGSVAPASHSLIFGNGHQSHNSADVSIDDSIHDGLSAANDMAPLAIAAGVPFRVYTACVIEKLNTAERTDTDATAGGGRGSTAHAHNNNSITNTIAAALRQQQPGGGGDAEGAGVLGGGGSVVDDFTGFALLHSRAMPPRFVPDPSAAAAAGSNGDAYPQASAEAANAPFVDAHGNNLGSPNDVYCTIVLYRPKRAAAAAGTHTQTPSDPSSGANGVTEGNAVVSATDAAALLGGSNSGHGSCNSYSGTGIVSAAAAASAMAGSGSTHHHHHATVSPMLLAASNTDGPLPPIGGGGIGVPPSPSATAQAAAATVDKNILLCAAHRHHDTFAKRYRECCELDYECFAQETVVVPWATRASTLEYTNVIAQQSWDEDGEAFLSIGGGLLFVKTPQNTNTTDAHEKRLAIVSRVGCVDVYKYAREVFEAERAVEESERCEAKAAEHMLLAEEEAEAEAAANSAVAVSGNAAMPAPSSQHLSIIAALKARAAAVLSSVAIPKLFPQEIVFWQTPPESAVDASAAGGGGVGGGANSSNGDSPSSAGTIGWDSSASISVAVDCASNFNPHELDPYACSPHNHHHHSGLLSPLHSPSHDGTINNSTNISRGLSDLSSNALPSAAGGAGGGGGVLEGLTGFIGGFLGGGSRVHNGYGSASANSFGSGGNLSSHHTGGSATLASNLLSTGYAYVSVPAAAVFSYSSICIATCYSHYAESVLREEGYAMPSAAAPLTSPTSGGGANANVSAGKGSAPPLDISYRCAGVMISVSSANQVAVAKVTRRHRHYFGREKDYNSAPASPTVHSPTASTAPRSGGDSYPSPSNGGGYRSQRSAEWCEASLPSTYPGEEVAFRISVPTTLPWNQRSIVQELIDFRIPLPADGAEAAQSPDTENSPTSLPPPNNAPGEEERLSARVANSAGQQYVVCFAQDQVASQWMGALLHVQCAPAVLRHQPITHLSAFGMVAHSGRPWRDEFRYALRNLPIRFFEGPNARSASEAVHNHSSAADGGGDHHHPSSPSPSSVLSLALQPVVQCVATFSVPRQVTKAYYCSRDRILIMGAADGSAAVVGEGSTTWRTLFTPSSRRMAAMTGEEAARALAINTVASVRIPTASLKRRGRFGARPGGAGSSRHNHSAGASTDVSLRERGGGGGGAAAVGPEGHLTAPGQGLSSAAALHSGSGALASAAQTAGGGGSPSAAAAEDVLAVHYRLLRTMFSIRCAFAEAIFIEVFSPLSMLMGGIPQPQPRQDMGLSSRGGGGIASFAVAAAVAPDAVTPTMLLLSQAQSQAVQAAPTSAPLSSQLSPARSSPPTANKKGATAAAKSSTNPSTSLGLGSNNSAKHANANSAERTTGHALPTNEEILSNRKDIAAMVAVTDVEPTIYHDVYMLTSPFAAALLHVAIRKTQQTATTLVIEEEEEVYPCDLDDGEEGSGSAADGGGSSALAPAERVITLSHTTNTLPELRHVSLAYVLRVLSRKVGHYTNVAGAQRGGGGSGGGGADGAGGGSHSQSSSAGGSGGLLSFFRRGGAKRTGQNDNGDDAFFFPGDDPLPPAAKTKTTAGSALALVSGGSSNGGKSGISSAAGSLSAVPSAAGSLPFVPSFSNAAAGVDGSASAGFSFNTTGALAASIVGAVPFSAAGYRYAYAADGSIIVSAATATAVRELMQSGGLGAALTPTRFSLVHAHLPEGLRDAVPPLAFLTSPSHFSRHSQRRRGAVAGGVSSGNAVLLHTMTDAARLDAAVSGGGLVAALTRPLVTGAAYGGNGYGGAASGLGDGKGGGVGGLRAAASRARVALAGGSQAQGHAQLSFGAGGPASSSLSSTAPLNRMTLPPSDAAMLLASPPSAANGTSHVTTEGPSSYSPPTLSTQTPPLAAAIASVQHSSEGAKALADATTTTTSTSRHRHHTGGSGGGNAKDSKESGGVGRFFSKIFGGRAAKEKEAAASEHSLPPTSREGGAEGGGGGGAIPNISNGATTGGGMSAAEAVRRGFITGNGSFANAPPVADGSPMSFINRGSYRQSAILAAADAAALGADFLSLPPPQPSSGSGVGPHHHQPSSQSSSHPSSYAHHQQRAAAATDVEIVSAIHSSHHWLPDHIICTIEDTASCGGATSADALSLSHPASAAAFSSDSAFRSATTAATAGDREPNLGRASCGSHGGGPQPIRRRRRIERTLHTISTPLILSLTSDRATDPTHYPNPSLFIAATAPAAANNAVSGSGGGANATTSAAAAGRALYAASLSWGVASYDHAPSLASLGGGEGITGVTTAAPAHSTNGTNGGGARHHWDPSSGSNSIASPPPPPADASSSSSPHADATTDAAPMPRQFRVRPIVQPELIDRFDVFAMDCAPENTISSLCDGYSHKVATGEDVPVTVVALDARLHGVVCILHVPGRSADHELYCFRDAALHEGFGAYSEASRTPGF